MVTNEGWAWGIATGEGEWLTIPGSAHRTPVLAATPGNATPFPSALIVREPDQIVLARVSPSYHPGVTVTQTAYRILERAPR